MTYLHWVSGYRSDRFAITLELVLNEMQQLCVDVNTNNKLREHQSDGSEKIGNAALYLSESSDYPGLKTTIFTIMNIFRFVFSRCEEDVKSKTARETE